MDKRYELREKIGQGGIGTVYRAYDHNLGREVAIKRILTSEDDPTLKDEATKQLMTEAGALASLQHPNIVIVQDVGADEDGPYVVMELINGKTLDEMIENGPLDWRDCRQVAMQSLEALIAAQQRNMIHSDLKPPNIMLSWLPSGTFQVKILDFGLATLIHLQSQEEIEKLESIFGSIFFMPPEQFERKVLDERSDLYSLGCCLYQALAGAYPFDGKTGEEVMASHLNHTVRPIGEIRSDVPEWACQWIMWLVNRYPDDRPKDAGEALANFMELDRQAAEALREEAAQQAAQAAQARKTQPVAIAGLSSTQLTGRAPLGMQGTASHGLPEDAPKSSLPKNFRLYVKIAAAAAVLMVIVLLVSMVKRRNERILRENTFHHLVGLASEKNVGEVLISGEHLELLLDAVRNPQPNMDPKAAYRALAVAKASDSTDFDAAIVRFATSSGLPDSVRMDFFTEVIAKRDGESLVAPMIRFSAAASKPEDAIAAIEAISHLAGDAHAEGLLDILVSSGQRKVRDAAEKLLVAVIRKSRYREDLAKLLAVRLGRDGSGEAGEALKRLLQLAKPQVAPKPSQQTEPKPSQPGSKPSQPAPPQKPLTGSPDQFKPLVEVLAGDDKEKKVQALSALGAATDVAAHAILLDFANDSRNASFRENALSSLLRLNSSPALLRTGEQVRQHWVQITWVVKTPREEKFVIDRLGTLNADWVPSILERMSQYSRNAETKALAKKALDSRK